MNNHVLREKAKEVCNSKLVLTYFVFELLMAGFSGLTATGASFNDPTSTKVAFTAALVSAGGAIIAALFEGPVFLGLIQAIKDNLEGKEAKVGTLFSKFNNIAKTFLVSLLTALYLCLWSLLFVIPAIIKSYSYSLVYYIHLEDDKLSAKECITKSRKMMDGHKWELFCLEFSYIGWYFLSIFTFGILLFWVLPKVETAKYLFYKELRDKEAPKAEFDF